MYMYIYICIYMYNQHLSIYLSIYLYIYIYIGWLGNWLNKRQSRHNLLTSFTRRIGRTHSEPRETSNTKLLTISYFHKKLNRRIFDWILNTPLNNKLFSRTHGKLCHQNNNLKSR